MIKHAIKAVIQILLIWILTIPVMLLGMPLVAIGLLFRREFPATKKPFSVYPEDTSKYWQLVRLPKILKYWDNEIDGAWGDTRGWWDNHVKTEWFAKVSKSAKKNGCQSFLAMWWWLAIRNPANHFKRFVLSADVAKYKVEKVFGKDEVDERDKEFGYHLLRCGSRYYFGLTYPWNDSRALVIRLGFKIRLSHNDEDFSGDRDYKKYKGFTSRISPYHDVSPSKY